MISVVIPMYNASKTISSCVNSVLKQAYKGEIEIIIINDGSTDDSLLIAKKIRSDNPSVNINLIDQLNGGVQMARNAGLRIAQGEWIALLDSDDCWNQHKLQMQMEVLMNNNNIDFLGCNRNNENTKILWRKKDKLSKINFKELFIKMYPQTSTAIFKKNILDDVGLYDETLRYGEDADYWLRICKKKQMYFMPESLVTTGGGKPNFGFSGLSANLGKMEKYHVRVLYKNFQQKNITIIEYALLRIFYLMKYSRRILISKMHKL